MGWTRQESGAVPGMNREHTTSSINERSDPMEKPNAYVEVLLDAEGKLLGVWFENEFFEASRADTDLVPDMVEPGWKVKLMKIWHNAPCCIQLGTQQVCWPPCIRR
jgi:hypothetical protein